MRRLMVVCTSMISLASMIRPVDGQLVRSNIGTLTCTVADAIAPEKKPDSEQRPVRCSFKPAADGAEQTYSGTLAKVGESRLPAAKLVLIWAVHGPEGAAAGPGFLAQSYIGRPIAGTDDPTMVLTGQTDNNIVLQSSATTGEADSEAVTILDLALSSIPT